MEAVRTCVRLPADGSSVREVREVVRRVARAAGWSDRVADVAVAVSEAATNVVLHAYSDPGAERGPILVTVGWDGSTFEVTVEDRGGGFLEGDRGARTGLGMGLGLMRALADEVDVVSSPEGTRVTLRFRRRDAGRRRSPPRDDESPASAGLSVPGGG